MTHPIKSLAAKHAEDPTPHQAEADRCVMCDWIILVAFAALLIGFLVVIL